MNTFNKNDSDRETQSLLNEEVIIDKRAKKSALFNTRNVLLVGGLVATGGMVGLSSGKSSAASSQNTMAGYKLGQDRPTIRLSVGCTPQDVLSLLPFEPKSWRGALFDDVVSLFVVVYISSLLRNFLLALACLRCVCVREKKNFLSSSKQQFTETLSLSSLALLRKRIIISKNITGKVGAKFITANMSPNFSYENAIEMPEEMCGVFAVPHELAHDARYGFFLYEKANPENFVSDIGVQPKGGYKDIEIIEEEVYEQPISKKQEKKQEKAKEMKVKEGEFEDGTKMTPTQREFFETKAKLANKESSSKSTKKASKKSAAIGEDEEVDAEEPKEAKKSSSPKKETAAEKMVRLQQEKIDLLEKEVQEAREADAEKERLAAEEEARRNEEAEQEKAKLERKEFLRQEKEEMEKAKMLAREKKNVGAFFDWGWWSSSLFHAEEEIANQSKKETTAGHNIKSRRALLSSAQNVAVPQVGKASKTTAKLSAAQQKKVEEYEREVSMIKNAKKHHKDIEVSSENPIEEEVVQARIEYPVQFISTMASCNTKHELEDTEYYPRKGVANPMGNNVFVFGACRSDLPQCGNPAQRHPGTCQVPKPDDDTFKLAVKACLDEDPVEGNCHKFAKQSEFGVMSMWDVSQVTDMTEAFADQDRFNGDLSQWDTRSVKYFDRMFSGAASFNQDISAWRYAAKKTDNHMFAGATAFQASWECGFRPSGLLDFHSCTSTRVMDDIVNGRVPAETSTSKKPAASNLINSVTNAIKKPIAAVEMVFTEPSVGLDEVGVLTDANIMDEVTDCLLAEPVRGDCHGQAFGPMSTWDVSRVTNMDQLFMDPPKSIEGDRHSSFNGDLSKWDVSSVTSMIRMFNRANAFNGDLSKWDVSKVESFSGMFKHTDRFNGDITNWNMKSAKSVDEMFMMALRFNQDISKWSLPKCTNFDRMFEFTGENGFAHDISNWDMHDGTHQDMFRDAFAFQHKFTCADVAHGPAHTCRPKASAAATPLTATRQPGQPAVAAQQMQQTQQTVNTASGKFVPQSEYDRVVDVNA
jgi:hypothetical protein